MPATKRNLSTKVREMIRAFLELFEDILKVASRLFSPNDDDYPETSVQPFLGDIPDHQHRHSSW